MYIGGGWAYGVTMMHKQMTFPWRRLLGVKFSVIERHSEYGYTEIKGERPRGGKSEWGG